MRGLISISWSADPLSSLTGCAIEAVDAELFDSVFTRLFGFASGRSAIIVANKMARGLLKSLVLDLKTAFVSE